MKKILLPVDGSVTCFGAFDYAKNLAQHFDAEIILLNAQDISPSFVWLNDPMLAANTQYDPKKIASEIVDKAARYFDELDIRITKMTEIGEAAHAIIDVADREEVDVIVMCTHGMSAMKRFLVGSVTNNVVHHAHVPVLVIK